VRRVTWMRTAKEACASNHLNLTNMKIHRMNISSRISLLTAVLLAIAVTAGPPTCRSSRTPAKTISTLRSHQPHHCDGTAVRADNVNRTSEQVNKDIALVRSSSTRFPRRTT